MEGDNQWMFDLVQGVLPQPTADFLQKHVFRPDSPVQLACQQLASLGQRASAAAYPVLEPLLDRAAQALYSSPAAVAFAVACLLLLAAIQALLWLRRAAMFATRLALRAAFWACVLALAAAVYQRGLANSVSDAAALAGRVVGFAAAAKDVWIHEYNRYESQTRQAGLYAHTAATQAAAAAAAGRRGPPAHLAGNAGGRSGWR